MSKALHNDSKMAFWMILNILGNGYKKLFYVRKYNV